MLNESIHEAGMSVLSCDHGDAITNLFEGGFELANAFNARRGGAGGW